MEIALVWILAIVCFVLGLNFGRSIGYNEGQQEVWDRFAEEERKLKDRKD